MQIRSELKLFLLAFTFLTRIPVPIKFDLSTVNSRDSVRYYSWVGLLIGACLGILAQILQTELSALSAIIIMTGFGLVLTGALHEDGFADCCDAFGSGASGAAALNIMKDPRLGSYGVCGLIIIIATKVALLAELPPSLWLSALLAAHCLSRLTACLIMIKAEYISGRDSKSGSVVSTLGPANGLILSIPAIIILLSLPIISSISLVITLVLTLFLLRRYFSVKLGGYTGDCLGATQQISEVLIYLVIVLSY